MTPVTDEQLKNIFFLAYYPFAFNPKSEVVEEMRGYVNHILAAVREQAYAEGKEAGLKEADEKVRELRGALQDILQHWRVVGGPMAEQGAIYAIATNALQHYTEQTGGS